MNKLIIYYNMFAFELNSYCQSHNNLNYTFDIIRNKMKYYIINLGSCVSSRQKKQKIQKEASRVEKR